MSSIFSFPRHRFYACKNCQRLVASDAKVCPHCDMDLGPESQVGAGASPFVHWNRTDAAQQDISIRTTQFITSFVQNRQFQRLFPPESEAHGASLLVAFRRPMQ